MAIAPISSGLFFLVWADFSNPSTCYGIVNARIWKFLKSKITFQKVEF